MQEVMEKENVDLETERKRELWTASENTRAEIDNIIRHKISGVIKNIQ